jgi:hypothetical protein
VTQVSAGGFHTVVRSRRRQRLGVGRQLRWQVGRRHDHAAYDAGTGASLAGVVEISAGRSTASRASPMARLGLGRRRYRPARRQRLRATRSRSASKR